MKPHLTLTFLGVSSNKPSKPVTREPRNAGDRKTKLDRTEQLWTKIITTDLNIFIIITKIRTFLQDFIEEDRVWAFVQTQQFSVFKAN